MYIGADKFSRNSRYFNVAWFERNKFSVNYKLNFGYFVAELLDYDKYMIHVTVKSDRKIYTFLKRKRPVKRIIINEKGNVLNIRKRLCIDDPYLFAVAIRTGLVKWEKKYETLFKICENVYMVKNEKGENMIEFRQNYRKVRVPILHCYNVGKFGTEYVKQKNLRGFRGVQKSRRRMIVHLKNKIFKTAISYRGVRKGLDDSG